MKSPIDVKIYSNRKYIGWILIAYKKIISFIVNPYLKIVFDEHNKMIINKLSQMENNYLEQINTLRETYDQYLRNFVNDILRRTDLVIMEVDKKVETDRVKLQELKKIKKEIEEIKIEFKKINET